MSGEPIERFIGPDAGAGGPFALLGISPGDAGAEQVTAALAERLARIDAHPHADTPDADEVRLALHASAAQLLDPVMAARMRERWASAEARANEARVGEPQRSADAARGAASAPIPASFQRDVLLTLAHAGGWKPGLAHRIAQLAHAHGLPPSAAVAAVGLLGRRRAGADDGGTRVSPARAGRAAAPVGDPGPARAGARPGVGMLGLGAALVLLLVSVGLAVIILPGALRGEAVAPAPPPEPGPIAAAEPEPVPVPAAVPTVAQRRDALGELSAAIAMLEADGSAAADGFGEAVGLVSRTWADLSPDARRATNTAVLDFLFRASRRSGAGVESMRAVAGPAMALSRPGAIAPDDVLPAAWSIGMLGRLVGERNLLLSMSREVDLALSRALGESAPTRALSGFEAGVLLGLDALSARLTPPTDGPDSGAEAARAREAWARWERALRAATGDNERIATRVRLGAIDRLLGDGPDVAQSGALREIVRELVISCSWREDSPARRWLVGAIADGRYSADDLQAVTLPLVTESSASGVDPSMVVRRAMGESERRAMADRYRAAWRLSDRRAEDEAAARWAGLWSRLSTLPDGTAGPEAHLRHAVALAHLNAAAAWRWRSDPERAALSLDAAEGMSTGPAPAVNAEAWSPSDGGSDGSWAMRYLSSPPDHASRLSVLQSRGGGPVTDAIDAEVLVLEAVRGATPQLRAAADAQLRAGSTPAVLNALLELAPTLPRTPAMSDLIAHATLTPRLSSEDPLWRFKARQRLVGALLERLAADGSGAIDVLARELADAYVQRADAGGESTAGPVEPRRAAALERARWRRLAAAGESDAELSGRLARADARATARRELAVGPVQRFAAEQVAALELMSVALMVERPGDAAAIDAILASHARARREASDIQEQLAVTELAVARLWAIRFDGVGAAS